jgi:hypothetical protein
MIMRLGVHECTRQVDVYLVRCPKGPSFGLTHQPEPPRLQGLNVGSLFAFNFLEKAPRIEMFSSNMEVDCIEMEI